MLRCFKAYDIRGRVGADLTPGIVRRTTRAFAEVLGARRVVVGRDCRLSSPGLAAAAIAGLAEAGAEALDLGLCGSEEVYCATAQFGAEGGVMVTASHNPADENGLKLVRSGAAPLTGADFAAIRAHVAAPGDSSISFERMGESGRAAYVAPEARTAYIAPEARAAYVAPEARAAYVTRVLSLVDAPALPPLRIVVNAGHGAAGPTFDALADALAEAGAAMTFIRLCHGPDGHFPQGVPNPMLPENRAATAEAVRAHGADLGLAWDGDFDRCFFFDDRGDFVPGEYVVALLAGALLARHPGAAIVHDPRVIWAITDAIARGGGRAVQARTGHAHLKQALRDSGAIYGGELSGHHYFRDFHCCDSGMIPWLMVAGLIGRRGSLSALVAGLRARFPSSGEINFHGLDPGAAISRVRHALAPEARSADLLDGLAMDMGGWRFSLRASNTEALLRLNVEAREDAALVAAGVARIRAALQD